MSVNPIPEGYHTVTPYFLVKDPNRFIQFLADAFGGKLLAKHETPDGHVMNAELRLGTSTVMLGEPPPGHPVMPMMHYLYFPDADAVYKKALAAGATSLHEMVDQFYGDRSGAVQDFEGNKWWIATRKENVSEDELKRRAAKLKR